MSEMQLPKWGDLNINERHKLLGELIDAMIYSGEAVQYLKVTVEQFRLMGYVRSVILPQNNSKRECPCCYGEGCNECVIILKNKF
ncbi:MAG: hypothetical protein ACK5S6_01230 [bacterium]|jgi:hypothetical protein